ncbi:hypothetical protein ACNKHP_22280 [Shigella boydii]
MEIWCDSAAPLDEKREYHAVAGLLIEYCSVFQNLAKKSGGGYLLKTLQVESHRVQKVKINRS